MNRKILRKLATVLLPHDYLNFYLTGKFHMEYGDASGTALLNVRTRQWDNEILEFIDRRSARENAGGWLFAQTGRDIEAGTGRTAGSIREMSSSARAAATT